MIINASIAEHYFKNKTVEDIKDHWIFNSIEKDKCLWENPAEENYERLKKIMDLLKESLERFKPLNIEIWEAFFEKYDSENNKVVVYITIGVPEPYDAMTLKDEKGKDCIILDLERIRGYSEDNNIIVKTIEELITHEVAHINIHKIYPWPSDDFKLDSLLKYITFNEGIAHLLGNEKNVLNLDWYSEEMMDRKSKAYNTLLKYINNNENENRDEILTKATCGRYWDKFACVAGMFALVDYYNLHNRDIGCFKQLYNKGIEELFSIISHKNINVE